MTHVAVIGTERGDLEQAAALLGSAPPHVVDDQPAHDAGGIAHEAGVIDEHGAVFAGDREVGFVQEGGDTKPADRSAPIELAAREPMQFGVERPEQRIRDNPFIARPARYFGDCVHYSHLSSFAAADSPGRPKCPPIYRIANGGEKTTWLSWGSGRESVNQDSQTHERPLRKWPEMPRNQTV